MRSRSMLIRFLVGTCLVFGTITLFADGDPGPIAQVQATLDWLGLSPGIIDGVFGPQTASAVISFQSVRGLQVTGQLDPDTTALLQKADGPRLVSYALQVSDFQGLAPVPEDWLARSRMKRLDHSTMLERLAERSHVTETLLTKMNPEVNWNALAPGQVIRLFDFSGSRVARAERIEVSLDARTVTAIGPDNQLIARFPCSIAAKVDKRPTGSFQVTTVAWDPSYTFDPAVYPEAGLRKKLPIPPGPNNPVGTVWIGLSKPGYGIHGTPDPEDVGRTGSHGCFRLTNWDVEKLARMVKPGITVLVRS